MRWIGLVLGALIGASFAGFRGSVLGAAIGFVAGEILRKARWPGGALPDASLLARLASVEQRLTLLEAKLGTESSARAAPPASDGASGAPAPEGQGSPPAAAPIASLEAAAATMRLPVRKGGAGISATTSDAALSRDTVTRRAANPLWAWFTGGNAMVRVGVVVVFFGIAFLLSYFAEHFTIPIEAKFAGVALIGAAMIGLGARLRRERRAYAMALIGGGLGVLYLTVFAAFELVPVLSPTLAFALLAGVAVLAAVLALRFDAQALAALAALGGLLAPVLVEVDASVALLFGYVAVVNATVLAVAWRRSWRALNLVGFALTLMFGLWWGSQFYRAEFFSSVEPFLVLFFAVYVAVPVANSLLARGEPDRRLDAVLVFGAPMAAFAPQASLVRGTSHGLAWSAAAVALVYAILWLALRGHRDPRVSALAASHAALALIFATLVVPLAVDPHWTSAIWAVEAAGIYWNACRQESRLGRIFGLLLQAAGGAAFLLGGAGADLAMPFANRVFMGSAAIAVSAFVMTRLGDSLGPRLPQSERALLPLLFAWACGWWLVGGAIEVARQVSTRLEVHAMLAWVIGSVGAGAALARPLRWARLHAVALVLLPALALAIGSDLWRRRTGMLALGWAVYPLGWAVYFGVLHRAEQTVPEAPESATAARAQRWAGLSAAHALGALLLLGQLAWEAGEWTARVTPRGTAWAACAHLLPLALYLFAIAFAARRSAWPMRSFGETYAGVVGTLVAIALGVGFAALAILHPGDASPLPYVPVLNPLEITLLIVLAAIVAWARLRHGSISLPRWIAAGAFVALNGAVVRAVHHWLDVPWRFASLAASKPLQAALTLTWSAAALALMLIANRRGTRSLWLAGAGLLAAAVIKLFVVDLAALSGLPRVVAFLGVGALLLVIGYVAPLPPSAPKDESNAGSTTPAGPRTT